MQYATFAALVLVLAVPACEPSMASDDSPAFDDVVPISLRYRYECIQSLEFAVLVPRVETFFVPGPDGLLLVEGEILPSQEIDVLVGLMSFQC